MFMLDENIENLIKDNIKKELLSLGCKDIGYYMDTYVDTIVEAINEAYNIEMEYMEEKIENAN